MRNGDWYLDYVADGLAAVVHAYSVRRLDVLSGGGGRDQMVGVDGAVARHLLAGTDRIVAVVAVVTGGSYCGVAFACDVGVRVHAEGVRVHAVAVAAVVVVHAIRLVRVVHVCDVTLYASLALAQSAHPVPAKVLCVVPFFDGFGSADGD